MANNSHKREELQKMQMVKRFIGEIKLKKLQKSSIKKIKIQCKEH